MQENESAMIYNYLSKNKFEQPLCLIVTRKPKTFYYLLIHQGSKYFDRPKLPSFWQLTVIWITLVHFLTYVRNPSQIYFGQQPQSALGTFSSSQVISSPLGKIYPC